MHFQLKKILLQKYLHRIIKYTLIIGCSKANFENWCCTDYKNYELDKDRTWGG
jgi:hypothetical protein